MIRNLFLVGLGGGVGSMLRYFVQQLFHNKTFPFATFSINVLGSFIIGLVIAFSLKNTAFETNWKLFLATGICGGFTTFSAFSLENILMIQQGKFLYSLIYIAGSILLGLIATWMGFVLINGKSI